MPTLIVPPKPRLVVIRDNCLSRQEGGEVGGGQQSRITMMPLAELLMPSEGCLWFSLPQAPNTGRRQPQTGTAPLSFFLFQRFYNTSDRVKKLFKKKVNLDAGCRVRSRGKWSYGESKQGPTGGSMGGSAPRFFLQRKFPCPRAKFLVRGCAGMVFLLGFMGAGRALAKGTAWAGS